MGLLKRIEQEKTEILSEGRQSIKETKKEDPLSDVKGIIHKKIIERIDTSMLGQEGEEQRFNAEIADIVEETLKEKELHLSRTERQTMIRYIIDESIGFGPISGHLLDEEVSEIMVNGPDQVYVEKKGRLELADTRFEDNQHVMRIIEKIVSPLGRRIDESSPMVDARLPDGSRVNAIIPPLALNGPTITIRKFAKNPLNVGNLISYGTMTPDMALFIHQYKAAIVQELLRAGTVLQCAQEVTGVTQPVDVLGGSGKELPSRAIGLQFFRMFVQDRRRIVFRIDGMAQEHDILVGLIVQLELKLLHLNAHLGADGGAACEEEVRNDDLARHVLFRERPAVAVDELERGDLCIDGIHYGLTIALHDQCFLGAVVRQVVEGVLHQTQQGREEHEQRKDEQGYPAEYGDLLATSGGAVRRDHCHVFQLQCTKLDSVSAIQSRYRMNNA